MAQPWLFPTSPSLMGESRALGMPGAGDSETMSEWLGLGEPGCTCRHPSAVSFPAPGPPMSPAPPTVAPHATGLPVPSQGSICSNNLAPPSAEPHLKWPQGAPVTLTLTALPSGLPGVDVLSDGRRLPTASLPAGHGEAGAGGGNGMGTPAVGTSAPADSGVPPRAGADLAMLAGSG